MSLEYEKAYISVFKLFNKRRKKKMTRKEKSPNSLLGSLQGAGPTGKNEEKIQVLTDKIDVLLQQVRGF